MIACVEYYKLELAITYSVSPNVDFMCKLLWLMPHGVCSGSCHNLGLINSKYDSNFLFRTVLNELNHITYFSRVCIGHVNL
jgi:hypothetical protein